MPDLTELTLDCHPAFDVHALHSIALSCPTLRTLRLYGRSSCSLNHLTAITGMLALTRIALGEQFFNDRVLLKPPRGISSSETPRGRASGTVSGLTPASRRALRALLPLCGGSLQVLQTAGPLAVHARRLLESSKTFSSLVLRMDNVDTSIWTRTPPFFAASLACAGTDTCPGILTL
jgi:hypothetical protein